MSAFLRQVSEYLFLRKKDPDAPTNTNVKFMHGMNRISIYLFLIALGVLIFRLLIRPMLH